MWGDWLEKGKELAHKAQAVAIDLDKQLNESVGLEGSSTSTNNNPNNISMNAAAVPPPIPIDEDEDLNDAWEGDEEDFADLDVKAPAVGTFLPPNVEGDHEPRQNSPTLEESKDEPQKEVSQGTTGGWEDEEELQFDDTDHEKPPARVDDGKCDGSASAELSAVLSTPVDTVEAKSEPVSPILTEAESAPIVEMSRKEPSPKEAPAVSLVAVDDDDEDAQQDGWSGHEADEDLLLNDEHDNQIPTAPVESSPIKDVPPLSPKEILAATPAVDSPHLAAKETSLEPSPLAEEPPKEEITVQQEDEAKEENCVVRVVEEASEEFTVTATAASVAETQSPAIAPPTEQLPTEQEAFPDATDKTTATTSLPRAVPQEISRLPSHQAELEKQLVDLQNRLQQREEQLFSKTEQMTTMAAMFESEKLELQQRVQNTKEEAKRRIQKAKERVESMEQRLQAAVQSNSSSSEESAKQADIIAALRSEGEHLARKQADMEKAVRAAKGEARDLRERLEDETTAKETAETRIVQLQAELSSTQEQLASARRGESQADILEAEVLKIKEDSEMKAATILALEQENKELKMQVKELQEDLEKALKGAAIETEREQKKLRKEHTDVVADFETKLRASEREAAVREDALRHEVDELRKRWQDAVRRADLLSMDVQNSTGPLLRQLESAERQNRARAAAWAELENSLRAELEENVISNEKLSKERSEWKTKFTRLERAATERDSELKTAKLTAEEKTLKVKHLEEKLEKMEIEGAKMKEEWAEIDRLANEGVSRVRSEMAQTVVELEERHKGQLESLQAELQKEQEKCSQLEAQMEEIIRHHQDMLLPPEAQPSTPVSAVKPMKLRQSDTQADILAGALNGLDRDDDDEQDEDEEDTNLSQSEGTGSYAAFSEYASRMKAQTVELKSLQQRLAESEKAREDMVAELSASRNAKEKLPLFETRVQELTKENQEMSLEIQGLQEDIAEVRELYRTQLNVLLEEKTAASDIASSTDGEKLDNANESPEQVPV